MLWMALRLLACMLLVHQCYGNGVTPRGYRLDLHPYPGDGVFKGRVRTDIVYQAPEPLQAITINVHASLNVIDREVKVARLADIDSSEEEEGSQEETVLSVSRVERKGENYTIHLSQKLQRDATYQLDVQFDGTLGVDNTRAFFQDSYMDQTTGERRWFVVLNLAPGTVRQVFPCFDEPQHKTWFELSVAHKGDFHILSSMPITDVINITKEGAWMRDHFSRTPPMSVNSLALLVSDFQQPQDINYLQTDGIRVGVWGRNDILSALSKSQQMLPTVMVSLEIYLSRPYPLPQLNLAALPGYKHDVPINAWGLQLFKESDLMNGNMYWLTYRLAKAAATQWLNHLTSPVNDCTVSAGLANFLANMVAKQLEQPSSSYNWCIGSLHTLFIELGKPKQFHNDPEIKKTIHENHAQLVMQMLEQALGPSTFKIAIQNFLAKKEFKMYKADDIWQAMSEQAWTDGALSHKITVKAIAESWLSKERLPVVTVKRDCENNTITFVQEVFVDDLDSRQFTGGRTVKKQSAGDQLWWIPLAIVTGRSANWSAGTPIAWLQPHQTQTTIANISDSQSYIILNPGGIAPYLVNYDTASWYRLCSVMTTLPEGVRLQLIHDSLMLAVAGQLSLVTALNVTSSLRTEQSPAVWRTFYPLAERLRGILHGTNASKDFDIYLQTLITPVLEALGEETDKSPTWKTDFRVKTRHLLCSAGFNTCIERAQTSYAIWVNSTQPDVGIPVASSHLCTVFAWGSVEEWEFGLQRLINYPTNRSSAERHFLLKTLAGCPHNTEKYDRLLNVTLLGDEYNETFSHEDRVAILSAISGDSAGYTTMFNFLRDNWDDLKVRLPSSLWEFYIYTSLSNFRTEEELKEVTELLEEKKGELGSAEKSSAEALARVKENVKWNAENIPAVLNWLTESLDQKLPSQRFKFQDIKVLTHGRKVV